MCTQRPDFAEFYRASADDCLRTVLVITGDRDSAQELVAEAFAHELPVPDPGILADRPVTPAASDPVDPRIMAALRRLPGRQRQVIALRLILDLDTLDTAKMPGIAPNTVMVHMARALAALRTDLVPELQQENQP